MGGVEEIDRFCCFARTQGRFQGSVKRSSRVAWHSAQSPHARDRSFLILGSFSEFDIVTPGSGREYQGGLHAPLCHFLDEKYLLPCNEVLQHDAAAQVSMR